MTESEVVDAINLEGAGGTVLYSDHGQTDKVPISSGEGFSAD